MKKKHITMIMLVAIMFLGAVNGKIVDTDKVNEEKKVATWKEVPIKNGISFSKCSGIEQFDLKNNIKNSDYIFSGEVVSTKEYEVEWTDNHGEKWGPFPSSIIEVKIKDEYYGVSPIKGNTIKVYYPYSLSTVFDGSFVIRDRMEYIFVTQNLDNEFKERKKKLAPDDNFQQEKHADVYISDSCYDIMAIEHNKVILHNDYFIWNKNAMNKVKKKYFVQKDSILSNDLIENGWFVVLSKEDFDKEFSNMIKNMDKLPNLKELEEIKMSKNN